MPPAIPIFVISLPQSQARRQQITARLDSLGLQCEITDAVSGAELNLKRTNPPVVRNGPRRSLARNEIGCFLSHYNLWKRMAEQGIEQAVILEDDATLQDDFPEIINALPTLGWYWDIVRLSAFNIHKEMAKAHGTPLAKWLSHYRLKRRMNRILCAIGGGGRFLVRHSRPSEDTAAYMITLKGAQILLRHCDRIAEPVDAVYEKWWKMDMHFLAIHPPVAGQMMPPAAEARSTIGVACRLAQAQAHPQPIRSKILSHLLKKQARLQAFWWGLRHPPRRAEQ